MMDSKDLKGPLLILFPMDALSLFSQRDHDYAGSLLKMEPIH